MLSVLLITCLVIAATSCSEDEKGSNDAGSAANNSSESGDVDAVKMEDRGDFMLLWEEPDNERYKGFEEPMKEIFEPLVEGFNEEIILPKDVMIVHTECGQANAFWIESESTIVMCYEMLEFILATFANAEISGWSDDDKATASLYTWLFIFFHELGHGFVDVYDIPITGQEEDAVDDFSTIFLLEADLDDVAISAAIFWALGAENDSLSATALADEHSLNQQRFYNILCLVYGSDPVRHAALESEFPERAARCEGEYMEKFEAWDELLDGWSK